MKPGAWLRPARSRNMRSSRSPAPAGTVRWFITTIMLNSSYRSVCKLIRCRYPYDTPGRRGCQSPGVPGVREAAEGAEGGARLGAEEAGGLGDRDGAEGVDQAGGGV